MSSKNYLHRRKGTWVWSGLILSFALAVSQGAPLTADPPVLLENTTGGFDFIRVDNIRHRLLLAHTHNKSFDVFDLTSRRLLKSLPTGAAQDSAVDSKRPRYYVAVSDPPKMAIVDANKLEILGEVALPAAADLMTFNPATGLAYVCNDTAPELWIIDPEAKHIVHTMTFKGKGMEGLTFDQQNKYLFQAVKTGNFLCLADPAKQQVLQAWSTEPAASPHGIELVPAANSILVAGANGKLVLINQSTGKVLASANIAQRVDEIAYDPEFHKAYCASSQAKISTVRVQDNNLESLGDVPAPAPVKSVVVDPKTHAVWIAYTKDNQSFVQPFNANQ